jgi:hypothetical protein
MLYDNYLTRQEIMTGFPLDTVRREEFDVGNPVADEGVSTNMVAIKILTFTNGFAPKKLDTEKESNLSVDCREAPPRPSLVNSRGGIVPRQVRSVLQRETKFAPIITEAQLWTGRTESEYIKSSPKLIRSQSSLSGSTDSSPKNKKEEQSKGCQCQIF